MKKAFAIVVISLFAAMAIPVAAQTDRYEAIATESLQRGIVDRLCDSIMEGRASGSKGGGYAREYILESFRRMELKPFYYHIGTGNVAAGGIDPAG